MGKRVDISAELAHELLVFATHEISDFVDLQGGKIDETNVLGLVYLCEIYSELDNAIGKAERDGEENNGA